MKDLVILAGPTAAGKTALSVKLAKRINGSIISADSMQVYKGMDIGTAKITKAEMEDVPHYLIDVLDPHDDFNIATFKEMAVSAMDDIYKAGRIPIMVGGTGFYIQSIIYDIDFSAEDTGGPYREHLQGLIDTFGAQYVHKMLEEADGEAAKRIHFNDHRRMIRALEYNANTGRKISEHNLESSEHVSPYNFCYFVLNDDRQRIYDRIDSRVDKMIEEGLVDEVTKLMKLGLTKNHVSMHGLGYKEIIEYLNGDRTLDEAVYKIKRDTRHFAKRQLTWFRREKDVIWLSAEDTDEDDLIGKMTDELKKKGIFNG
ncbi:MAG: tRNA (adenosine(37)-N6)-dimethylallyltransferase MiaA [Lachnospiraceae bacterium]|nr:tRNA (adenosine(37)-N6)-dimethylallyltransferase MiaA [Lachnospiraceae bacterium]